ncbi:SDR family oxidoreductase [Streptomyces spongiae]|uniref:SDR family NAD(P)-dependent oxidoreductase n=1 Tax=Streptomyces spongiae TaxID=565072 RepID=A0A5N8X8K5_9ACTN|nr:SDR family oxidoreductase [Streptomyces spongiae]MPY55677.1 SDR family NAD(P)-dependent oxidoreductase [Streptomyces spongiae]
MSTQHPFAGRTLLMSGGSRGIGLAIAVRAARDGANVAFIAKTDAPDPRLPGTVHTAAAEIEAAGGKALPIVGDIRDDDTVFDAVARTAARFGGIDTVVNNASAIALSGVGELPLKRYDLMQDINARGTFALTSAALPYLLKSSAPRVLTLSPPLNLNRRWLARHAPYTVSKYAMTMLTLGVAEQYREQGIAAGCLWPRTLVATAAVRNVVGGEDGMRASRRPEIMADAAAAILALPASESNGQCYVDEEVLRSAGVFDLSCYLHDGAAEESLETDLFL